MILADILCTANQQNNIRKAKCRQCVKLISVYVMKLRKFIVKSHVSASTVNHGILSPIRVRWE